MTQYITQADYRRQKTALTRAINSGDPLKVLATVEKTLEEWGHSAWPDAWSRWSVALYDAYMAFTRQWESAYSVEDRFKKALSQFP